jgi:class 3 adenylate cyclase
MARLDSTKRADLPNSAFAYVDSRGRRRLPINDEAHVRNALARFSQVVFEDEAARERARKRLLNAAKKYGIVPVGFITGQLQSERENAELRAREPAPLPSGFVTMLMTDVEGSTALVHRLGDRYGELINDVRTILNDTVLRAHGDVVETRADDFFAVFERPRSAVETAIAIQRELGGRAWDGNLQVRVRIGIHSGHPTPNAGNYIGMAVHTAARISAAAHGGQILVSGATRDVTRDMSADGVRFRNLGQFRLRGLPEPVALFQVGARGLAAKFPPPTATAAPIG